MHVRSTWHALIGVLLTSTVLVSACSSPAPAAPTGAPAAKPTEATVAKPVAASPAASPAAAGASPIASPAAAPKPAANAPAPKKGGTAVLAIDADPETLNLATTTGYSAGDVGSKIFEGLIWLDPNFAPQPALATSWTISPDGKSYTFKLRSGVKWHDGQDFTSADVKYTFEEVLAKLHPRTQTTLKRLDGIDTPDPLTVVIRLKEAYAPFILQQTAFDAPIIPKHVYDGTDATKNPANQAPIGTGPFKFKEWKRGASLAVVRNDAYWDPGKPYLDSIVFQIVPQGANRSTGLETGEIDFVVDFYLAKADVGRLSTNDKIQSKRGQGAPAIDFVMLNTKSAALSKKEARQAIAQAVNRPLQVQQAMGGLGRPGFGPLGDGFKWLVNPDAAYDKLYPLDPAKAKAKLDAAGVPANTTLRLIYDTARPNFVAGAQILRDNLRAIGLNLDLQPLERSVMIDKVFAQKEYDLALQSFASSGDPSIGYHRLYITTDSKAQFTNSTGYSNPRVDELLSKAAVAPVQADRATAYKEVEAILADEMPALVLYDEEGVDMATKKLQGLWSSIESRDRWGEVFLSQ